MIGDILQPTHLLFVLVIALIVLGPKRLPEAGRSLGRGLRDFKDALSGEERNELTQAPVAQAPGTQAPVAQAPGTQAPVAQAPGTQAAVAEAGGPQVAAGESAPVVDAATVPPAPNGHPAAGPTPSAPTIMPEPTEPAPPVPTGVPAATEPAPPAPTPSPPATPAPDAEPAEHAGA